MTDTPDVPPAGMVDSLPGSGGPTEDELAFARSYLGDGDMDPTVLARLAAPGYAEQRAAQRSERLARDWAGLAHYRDANAALAGQTAEVVFLGDSITEMWRVAQPDLFEGGVLNRGISGQTSPQLLLRFMADVAAFRPRVLHLMCGVNDIAGNTGPTTPGDYQANVGAMLDLAARHGMRVVVGSLTPVGAFAWAPEIREPFRRVAELNGWLRETAEARGLVFADYHAVLATPDGALKPELTRDGVHPTGRGYAVMRPVAEAALEAARKQASG